MYTHHKIPTSPAPTQNDEIPAIIVTCMLTIELESGLFDWLTVTPSVIGWQSQGADCIGRMLNSPELIGINCGFTFVDGGEVSFVVNFWVV